MSKICCFTGSRDIERGIYRSVYLSLEKLLIELIEDEGITDFRAGGARGFDTIAAFCVCELRKKYPHIKLHLILPCKNQEKMFSEKEKEAYRMLLGMADSVTFLQERYDGRVMLRRNQALVDGSDLCVAFLQKLSGGTYQTVNFARKQGVRTINLVALMK